MNRGYCEGLIQGSKTLRVIKASILLCVLPPDHLALLIGLAGAGDGQLLHALGGAVTFLSFEWRGLLFLYLFLLETAEGQVPRLDVL